MDDKRIPQEWLDEFEDAARRTIEQRVKYGFIKTFKPVLDDEPFRSFESMAQYRDWCNKNLPWWLGYWSDDLLTSRVKRQ